RSGRKAGGQRRVAGGLLQEEGDEEERADQTRVDDQRLEVGDGEVPAPEEAEVEHRVPVAGLPAEEEREEQDTADQRDQDDRVAPAVHRLLDESENDPPEAERRHQDSEPVDRAIGLRIEALPAGRGGPGNREVDK